MLTLLLLATACSPELNWRELRSDTGGFIAIVPGKPRLDEREIAGERGVVMHLWSSEAGGAVFGVGYTDYSSSQVPLDRTRDALVANIKGRIVEDTKISLGAAKGREFRAEGPAMVLAARLLASGSRLYQVLVVSPKERIAPADVELFLSSFQLLPEK
jgi:hypothetical protein